MYIKFYFGGEMFVDTMFAGKFYHYSQNYVYKQKILGQNINGKH